MKVAVIVPTIRPELFKKDFLPAWSEQFNKHGVHLYAVYDGDEPVVHYINFSGSPQADLPREEEYPFIYNRTDAVRNLGFITALRHTDPDIYISLDDDVLPYGDTIGDHIGVLTKEANNTWLNTSTTHRMRGLPYNLPQYPILLSHGVWRGVPDLDAIQQLQHPHMRDVAFEKTIVPRGVFFPLCAMNFAFRRELLPYAYQAPMGRKLITDGLPAYDRFADIWSGVVMQDALSLIDGIAATGYATVIHQRASNVYTNLKKEALGMELNENMHLYVGLITSGFAVAPGDMSNEAKEYVKLYSTRLNQWQKEVEKYAVR